MYLIIPFNSDCEEIKYIINKKYHEGTQTNSGAVNIFVGLMSSDVIYYYLGQQLYGNQ